MTRTINFPDDSSIETFEALMTETLDELRGENLENPDFNLDNFDLGRVEALIIAGFMDHALAKYGIVVSASDAVGYGIIRVMTGATAALGATIQAELTARTVN